ncbi:MAG: tyrosine-protein phosphatase [Coprobacillus sp.]|nr:tyrosine-protein phosphatase [Coprobacillus sp.]
MMQLSREERLLHIGKMTNVRDLGGYETQEGYYTKSHKYVRSTCPSGISDELKEQFYQYGIRTVIDLRSDYELIHQPHSLKDYKDIEYYHIDLLQNENLSVLPDDIKDYQDLSGFYIFMIEANKKQFKKVFNIFLNHPYDCTLFILSFIPSLFYMIYKILAMGECYFLVNFLSDFSAASAFVKNPMIFHIYSKCLRFCLSPQIRQKV